MTPQEADRIIAEFMGELSIKVVGEYVKEVKHPYSQSLDALVSVCIKYKKQFGINLGFFIFMGLINYEDPDVWAKVGAIEAAKVVKESLGE